MFEYLNQVFLIIQCFNQLTLAFFFFTSEIFFKVSFFKTEFI